MFDARSPLTTGRADCVACGRSHILSARTEACDCDRRENLALHYSLDAETGSALRGSLAGNAPSLWRYAPLLPVESRFASRLQVGWTPLIDCGPCGSAHLFLKDETRLPSGSLKDRASEMVVAVAVAHGIDQVIVASTGNAAASLACIGAAAGVQVTVLVPATVPPAKLAQIVAYGARVHRVAGRYDDAFVMAGKIAEAQGIINRSTGLNPFTREGKKTCALEIAEQLGWQAPDWVIVPTGDGNILSAVWQGFRELAALGWLERMPRLVAVQSVASRYITSVFNGEEPRSAGNGETIADSITVGHARDATAALAALNESAGVAVTVDDDEIIAAVLALGARFGMFAEPSSAAAFAAFERLNEAGRFARGDRVVCLITGTGLKDLRPVLAASALDAEPAVDPADWRSIVPVAAQPVEPAACA
ncbi:threonine synthase [Sphingomonas oligophenolica]|uniref:Threonine synthase n=1 Tax=Sphingomonas oligophenolica TaxID=301154 RepID=A0ABU9Y9R1_9SPHN